MQPSVNNALLSFFLSGSFLLCVAQDIPLAAPQGVRVSEGGETSALVTWLPALGNPSNLTFEVSRDGSALGTTSLTNFTDSGPLDKYRSYEYSVRAWDGAGNTSLLSAPVVFAYHRSPFAISWTNSPFPSVTDMSSLTAGPATNFILATNGQLYAGGNPFRIFGVNCVYEAAFPPHDMAEQVAARLARVGVNCVRLHGLDSNAKSKGIFLDVPSSDPQYRRALDPQKMERLDYFVAQLKARGIYIDLNLRVQRDYPGFPTNGFSLHFQGVDLYMPGMIDLQKEYARDLLTHLNPYTGLSYTAEPAVAIVEINNENGLIHSWHGGIFNASLAPAYLNELSNQWNAWLTAHYTNSIALSNGWAASPGSAYGTELLTNGYFANGLSSWILAVSNPAVVLSQWVTNEVPDAARALELNVTSPALSNAPVCLFQSGLNLANTQAYTASLRAKAEAPCTAFVSLAQNAAPYQVLASRSINLTTQWQEFKLVMTPNSSEANARLELGGLGLQTGRVWLSQVSVKTGNTILGMAANPEGAYAPEMLVNGSFAAGFVTPWRFQTSAPAAGSSSLVANGAPDGSTALEINVTTNSAGGGYVQFYQSGLRVTNGQPYTLRFSAKSEKARSITPKLEQVYSPWVNLGSAAVSLGTNWQDYVSVIVATADETSARINLAGLGSVTGRIWFANFSLKPGTPSAGLLEGETLGTVSLVPKDQYGARTRAVQRDWMQFLWDTERAYWNGMKDYLHGTLGAHALVVGTQTSYSPGLIQADMDVVDCHVYWQHPTYPGTAGDPSNWYFNNEPMAGYPGGTLTWMAPGRIAGKPFICTEYNHPAPNTFSAETFPLASAYAALQGWDGLFAYEFLVNTNFQQGYFDGQYDLATHPAKLITLPFAAALLRRQDVTPSLGEDRATITAEMALRKLGQTDSSIGAADFGLDAMNAYTRRQSFATGEIAQSSSVLLITNAPFITSDTGQLFWDTARRVMTLRAPLTKALIGHADQQTFDLGDGVLVTPEDTMQSTNWAAITLQVTEGAGLHSANGSRMLVTASGYADNHRMLWKSGLGPTNATSSVGTNWGIAPALVEGVPATVILPVAPNQVAVYALNERGERKAIVPVMNVNGQAGLHLTREYSTPWYEVTLGLNTNYPPILVPLPDQVVNIGETLTLANQASDIDVVPQRLTFSLLSAPTNATVTADTGLFLWQPTAAQVGSTNLVTVKVSDAGTPPLSATQSFLVIVPPPPQAPDLAAWAGPSNQVSLAWETSPGATGYRISRALNLAGPYLPIASISNTTWVDTDVADNTLYYYLITATNANGTSISTNVLATGRPITLDNADSAGITITGAWGTSTNGAGYYGSNYLHDGNAGLTNSKSVRFNPTLPCAGDYAVFVRWTASPNRATNAPVDVNYSGGTARFSLNQQTNGATWHLLGTFPFLAGTLGSVLIRNDGASGYVIADAVQFVPRFKVVPPSRLATLGKPGANGQFNFTLESLTGYRLELLATTNLTLPISSWQSLGPLTNGGAPIPCTDATTNSPRRFFRARTIP